MFDLFFSYVYRFMHRYMGVRRPLSYPEKTLAWMFSLYDFNYTLSSVFMNVFLFKKHFDLEVVCLFNLTQFAVIAPAFWLGGHLSKRFGNLLSYQLGFFFSATVFAATLVLRQNAPDHPYFLGLLSGLGIGFYFLGEHSLTLEATSEKTRDYFLSVSTFFTSILCILAPQISGWLIRAFKGPSIPEMTPHGGEGSLMGYYLVFAIALAIYVLLIYKSLRFKAEPTGRGFYFWKVLTFKNNGDWDRLMGVQLFLGLRQGVFWFLVPLLVYQFSMNEAVVGGYLTFSNLLGVLTAYGLSLWAKTENRWNGLWISSWLLGLAAVGIVANFNYFTLCAYALLNMVGGTWLQVVYGAFSFTVLEKARESKKNRIEYIATREFPLALGRVLGLFILLASQFYFGGMGFRISLLLLGFSHMGLLVLLPKKKVGEIHASHLKKA